MLKNYWLQIELIRRCLDKIKYKDTLLNPKNLETIESIGKFKKMGADFNLRDRNGFTPLEIAFRHFDLSIIKFLLKMGAEIDKCRTLRIIDWVSSKEHLAMDKLRLILASTPDLGGKFDEYGGLYSAEAVKLLNDYVEDREKFYSKYEDYISVEDILFSN